MIFGYFHLILFFMKRLSVKIAIFCITASCFSAVPKWVTNQEKEFPSSKYVAAMGEGNTEKKAMAAALAGVSQFFDTKTEVLTLAVKKFDSVQVGGSYQTSANSSLDQITKVSSEAEFFGLNYAPTYHNEKRNVYNVLAYVDKAEAAKTYKGYINTLMDAIKNYRSAAQNDSEAFNSALYMQKAEALSVLAASYIKTLGIIEPNSLNTYKSDSELINLLPIERSQYKKKATFSVSLKQEDVKLAQLTDSVAEILENRGYIYSETNGRYQVLLNITCNEEQYDIGPFVRPSLKITITNPNGDSLYSYSKKYQRVGAKTSDLAYTRAVLKIEEDLKENFLSE